MPLRRLLLPLLLLAVALGAHGLRRALIRSFFVDGPPGPAPALTAGGEPAAPLPPAPRVRVVLIDGLGREAAAALPALSGLCAGGLDLVVDTGFPTVSLPVQHALWTGLSQQQSGVEYRIARLRRPPAAALPARVPGAVAVAESHPDIVHSFGFSRALPPLGTPDDDPAWRGGGFAAAARELAAGDARLGLVHVLRVDEAGHRHGGASAAYREAARGADEILADLLEADRRAHPGGTAWLVLADHGHLPQGGHGDAEEPIRLVRACLAGAAPPASPPGQAPADVGASARGQRPSEAGRRLHLVDLSRALFELTGAPMAADAPGRPLAVALAHPDPGATLPRAPAAAWLAALLLGLAGLALGLRALPRAWALPLWLPLGCAAVALVHGAPTLSSRVIYPPLGRDMTLAALPGLLALVATFAVGLRRASAARLAVAQLALPAGAALGALCLCGGLPRLLRLTSAPPLVPLWTGRASLLLALLASGAAAAALSALVAAARAPSGPSPRAGSAGRSA